MDCPHKLKLHDTFVTIMDEDCYNWHGKIVPTLSPLDGHPMDEVESKILDFLSKKERLDFYRLCAQGKVYYKNFSDEDVAFIKEEFEPDIEMALGNDNEEGDWYIKHASGSPSDPIWQLTEVHEMYAGEPIQINLGKVEHFYAMSRSFCDVRNGEIKRTAGFGVPLTDDEYVYLVCQIIDHNYEYFFTDLALDEPELARKIYWFSMYSNPYHVDEEVTHLPFLINFDELEEDARKIVL